MTQEKKKILIVEDESVFLELLTEKFTDQGFEVVTATNGKEGLQMAEREHPDAIVTDLTMPIMDGVEFIRNLRAKDSWGKKAFVIILSNRGDMDSIADTVDLGAHHYFVKADIDPGKVVESVLTYTSSL
ncbi:MAG: response regulator [Patescibacteria group bacterium]